jgi:uncharacterized coiled-coil protein SlyX
MDKMKNHYQITIDKLHRRIEELEAEVASESKWAETYNNRVVELKAEVERLAHVVQQQAALINAQRAEIETLKLDNATEGRWADHHKRQSDEFMALNTALQSEIDRLCQMLGEADAKLTEPPQAGWTPEQFKDWKAA